MELGFTAEEEAFRGEVRDFCATETIQMDYPGASRGLKGGYSKQFFRKMGEAGFLGLQLPTRYGGRGLDAVHETIFAEELGYAGAPSGNYAGTVLEFGHLVMQHGSEWQRREYLPRLTRGELTAGHAYTEPEAGSDLASVRTRAVRDGDHYVVNGQKMFASEIHRTDYTALSARTDPDAPTERGVSLFILDNRLPGITHSRLATLGGKGTNQMFLDDVRIPVENLIGEENRGWDYFRAIRVEYWAKNQGYYCGKLQRMFEMMVSHARETRVGGRPLAQDPVIRQKLARTAIDIRGLRLISYRLAALASHDPEEARSFCSVVKVFTDEAILRIGNVALDLLGVAGQLEKGSPLAPLEGLIENAYRENALKHFSSLGHSFARTVLATERLGLPEA